MTSLMASNVANLRETFVDLQEVAPNGFREFLDILRAASGEVWRQVVLRAVLFR